MATSRTDIIYSVRAILISAFICAVVLSLSGASATEPPFVTQPPAKADAAVDPQAAPLIPIAPIFPPAMSPGHPTIPEGGLASIAPNNRVEPPRRRHRPIYRLANAPDMFGDGLVTNRLTTATTGVSGTFIGPTHLKIADNGSALPKDRFYLDYRYFHNAFEERSFTGSRSGSLSRYTIGVEKVFGQTDDWSVEFRLPLYDGTNLTLPGTHGVEADGVGNLSVILKRSLAQTDTYVISAGLGISLPTGDDTSLTVMGSPIAQHNESVHLMPWIGFLRTPGERTFMQGFAQVDVAANGNSVSSPAGSGILNDPALLYLDLEAGYWLIPRNQSNSVGLASVVELHYTGTLQDGDSVTGLSNTSTVSSHQFHSLNLTVGAHMKIRDNLSLRAGMAFPLTNGPGRFFDTETIATLVWRY